MLLSCASKAMTRISNLQFTIITKDFVSNAYCTVYSADRVGMPVVRKPGFKWPGTRLPISTAMGLVYTWEHHSLDSDNIRQVFLMTLSQRYKLQFWCLLWGSSRAQWLTDFTGQTKHFCFWKSFVPLGQKSESDGWTWGSTITEQFILNPFTSILPFKYLIRESWGSSSVDKCMQAWIRSTTYYYVERQIWRKCEVWLCPKHFYQYQAGWLECFRKCWSPGIFSANCL